MEHFYIDFRWTGGAGYSLIHGETMRFTISRYTIPCLDDWTDDPANNDWHFDDLFALIRQYGHPNLVVLVTEDRDYILHYEDQA